MTITHKNTKTQENEFCLIIDFHLLDDGTGRDDGTSITLSDKITEVHIEPDLTLENNHHAGR